MEYRYVFFSLSVYEGSMDLGNCEHTTYFL